MYKLLFSILFFTLYSGLAAQNTARLIRKVSDHLMIAKTGSANKRCIQDPKTGINLSCFDIQGKPEWVADLNGDGEEDLVLFILDEGLGGGGNTYGFEYYVVIMKDGNVSEIHPLFGGGQFSYGTLGIERVSKGKIEAIYEENPNSRNRYGEDDPPYERISLVFEYLDGFLVEKSYYKCPIAEMDKRIFKANSAYPVERTTQLNELFEVEQREKIFLELDKSYIYATLSGCQNPQIRFSLEIPYSEDFETDNVFLGRTVLDYIRILQENTRYSSILTLLMKRVQNAYFYSTPDELFSATYSLPNQWEAWVRAIKVTTDKGDFARLILHLDKKENPEKTFFWDQIKR